MGKPRLREAAWLALISLQINSPSFQSRKLSQREGSRPDAGLWSTMMLSLIMEGWSSCPAVFCFISFYAALRLMRCWKASDMWLTSIPDCLSLILSPGVEMCPVKCCFVRILLCFAFLFCFLTLAFKYTGCQALALKKHCQRNVPALEAKGAEVYNGPLLLGKVIPQPWTLSCTLTCWEIFRNS